MWNSRHHLKKPASVSIIRTMNDTLIHCGPDDERYLLGGQNNPDIPLNKLDQVNSSIPFMFGHRRQATIVPGESEPKEYLQETAFQNIYRLEPAHYLKCHVSEIFNQLKTVRYWEVIPNLSDEPYNEKKAMGYAHQYMTLLSDAVKLRLRADVKTGSSLSGGLDTSSIVWLVDQHLKAEGSEEKQQTFSCIYHTPGCEYCDESSYINELAAFLDLQSHTIELDEKNVLTAHKKVAYYLDTPTESTMMSGWHTYFLARKNNVKVILEGQGADEQLNGYIKYLGAYYATIPLDQLIRELVRFQSIPGAAFSIVSGVSLNILRHLFGEKRSLSLLRHFKISYSYMPLNKRLTDDLLLSLATLFHYADRGSMVHSIETRMPFMDCRLVEYLASVPASYKIHAGWTKYVARKAFNKKLPDSVCWRKDKMGWPVPEEIWFRGELKDTLIKTILNSGFIEQCGLDQNNLNEKNISQKYPLRMLIRAYILEIWFTTFWNGDNE